MQAATVQINGHDEAIDAVMPLTRCKDKPFSIAVIELLVGAVRSQGMAFSPRLLLPVGVRLNRKSEFEQGVLAMALEVYYLASQTTEGRQAILDLGLEPFFENVKSPASGGSND